MDKDNELRSESNLTGQSKVMDGYDKPMGNAGREGGCNNGTLSTGLVLHSVWTTSSSSSSNITT